MKILSALFFIFLGSLCSPFCLAKAEQKSSQTERILFLGDSLTEGYGISTNNAFPTLVEKMLKDKKHNIEITNAGISGSTSASAYLRLKAQIKNNYSILVLALGSNDGLRGIPPETTSKNLEKAIKLALENKIKVLLLGAKVPPNYGKDFSKKFDAIFVDLKNKYKISLMPFLLEDVAGNKELNQEDAIHPNEKGHKIIAKNLTPYIEKLL